MKMIEKNQNTRFYRYLLWMAACTFFLIIAGGSVTSTRSGLAVPDWPLSFGKFFPPMVGGVFFEHGHRMVAGVVAMLTLVMVIWCWAARQALHIRVLAGCALGAVIFQAVLGGLTVLLKLPAPVSVGHACLAQIFFCLIISLATLSSPSWQSHLGENYSFDSLSKFLVLLIPLLVFVQTILGATIRHEYAGLIIPDFPTSFGQWIPPFGSYLVVVSFSHRVMAAIILIAIFVTSWRILRLYHANPWITGPAKLLVVAVVAQVILGASTVWSQLQPVVATAHVAGGAFVLATSLVLCLRCWKLSAAPSSLSSQAPVLS